MLRRTRSGSFDTFDWVCAVLLAGLAVASAVMAALMLIRG